MRAPSYSLLYDEVSRISAGFVPAWLTLAVADALAGRRPVVRHPLGWLCLPVLRLPGYGVCVHVWAPWAVPERPTTSLVHCHSWDLRSIVVAGGLRNHLPRVLRAGPPSHRVFEIRSLGYDDEIRMTGDLACCRPGTVETYRAGQVYTVPAGQFHMTEVLGPDTTTTVVLARNLPGRVDLSLGPLSISSHRVRRRLCSMAEGARAAREVGRLLGLEPGERTRPDR